MPTFISAGNQLLLLLSIKAKPGLLEVCGEGLDEDAGSLERPLLVGLDTGPETHSGLCSFTRKMWGCGGLSEMASSTAAPSDPTKQGARTQPWSRLGTVTGSHFPLAQDGVRAAGKSHSATGHLAPWLPGPPVVSAGPRQGKVERTGRSGPRDLSRCPLTRKLLRGNHLPAQIGGF